MWVIFEGRYVHFVQVWVVIFLSKHAVLQAAFQSLRILSCQGLLNQLFYATASSCPIVKAPQLCGWSQRWSDFFSFPLAAGLLVDCPSAFHLCCRCCFLPLAFPFFTSLFSVSACLMSLKHYIDLLTFKKHVKNFGRKPQLLWLIFKMLQQCSLVLFAHQSPLYCFQFPLSEASHHTWHRTWGSPFYCFFDSNIPSPPLLFFLCP